MKHVRHQIISYGLIVLSVTCLGLGWEFLLEPTIFLNNAESFDEKMSFVIMIFIFSIVSVIYPCIRSIKRLKIMRMSITSLKKAEENLQYAHQELRSIMASIPEGILTCSCQGYVSDFNEATTRIFGYDGKELLGQNISMLVPNRFKAGHDNHVAQWKNDKKARQKVQKRFRELCGLRKDGTEFPIEIHINPLNDQNGTSDILITIRDITEEVRVLREKKLAEAANQSKAKFLATMSHELRTPLNAIIGFSDIIKSEIMGPVNDTYKVYAEDINDSGLHLMDLIGDILEISKIEAGGIDLEVQPLRIDKLLRFVSIVIEEKCYKKKLGFKINNYLGPKEEINVDVLKIKQVLINLLTNAVKFTKKGSVTLEIKKTDTEIIFIVSDTGMGIAPEDLGLIFEPFVRTKSAEKKAIEGTGLGLGLAKKMVEAHNGTIDIISVVNKGTEVTIRLPIT